MQGPGVETHLSAARPFTGSPQATCLLFVFSPTDAHSLVINLTVQSRSRPGQPWYKFQASVGKEPFLQYDSDSNEVRPLGPVREKLKATRVWTELPQTLRDMGPEIRIILLNSSLEGNKTRGK